MSVCTKMGLVFLSVNICIEILKSSGREVLGRGNPKPGAGVVYCS